MEGIAQPFHGVGMKAHPVANTGNPAYEKPVFVVIFDPGSIVLVGHGVRHGLTPIRSRKSRASRTWYRLASLAGCGRWNVATSPSFSNRTRDPRPSIIRAPVAKSRLSIATHSMVPDTGSVKTAARVLRCLLFIDE